MSIVLKDRVRETTTTTGTGTLTLGGAVTGFQAFSAIGDGNETYYVIEDPATGDWEVGLGTYTASGTTLSRDSVYDSSNSGSVVNFGAGEKRVFVSYPADRAVVDTLTQTLTNKTITSPLGIEADDIGYDNSTSGLTATDVKAALDELESEKLAKSGGTMTGDLTMDSNGIYLGGTGAANYLDDYEEGTWTPVLTATNGFVGDPAPSSTEGKYTKIGRLVHCTGKLVFASSQTHSVFSYIDGLPFSSVSTEAGGVYGTAGAADGNAAGFVRVGLSADSFSLTQSNVSVGSNATFLFQFTYVVS